MFYIFMQTDPDFDMDIKDDVEEECSKYGRVKHIYVDRWVYQLYHISFYPRLIYIYIVYDYFSEPVIGLQDFCISIVLVKYQDDLEIRTISLKKFKILSFNIYKGALFWIVNDILLNPIHVIVICVCMMYLNLDFWHTEIVLVVCICGLKL